MKPDEPGNFGQNEAKFLGFRGQRVVKAAPDDGLGAPDLPRAPPPNLRHQPALKPNPTRIMLLPIGFQ